MATLKVPVTSEDYVQGNENAPITLVEYGDYECPYCGFAYPIVKQAQKHFGSQLRLVFRNFPMSQAHPDAEAAAEAAEFAGAHGRFWEMHDLIYEGQSHLSVPFLLKLAEKLELSTKELELAIQNKTYESKIKKDFLGGVRSGVNGTPTFFINDQRHNGSIDLLIPAIDSVLKVNR